MFYLYISTRGRKIAQFRATLHLLEPESFVSLARILEGDACEDRRLSEMGWEVFSATAIPPELEKAAEHGWNLSEKEGLPGCAPIQEAFLKGWKAGFEGKPVAKRSRFSKEKFYLLGHESGRRDMELWKKGFYPVTQLKT